MNSVHQYIHAACGAYGHKVLGTKQPMAWQVSETDDTPLDSPDAHTLKVELIVRDDAGEQIDSLTMDGDTWRTIESEGLIDQKEMLHALHTGTLLIDALSMQVNEYRNHYIHCGQPWTDVWSCTCNDRCPVCDAEIEPTHSDDLRVLEEGDDGVCRLVVHDASQLSAAA